MPDDPSITFGQRQQQLSAIEIKSRARSAMARTVTGTHASLANQAALVAPQVARTYPGAVAVAAQSGDQSNVDAVVQGGTKAKSDSGDWWNPGDALSAVGSAVASAGEAVGAATSAVSRGVQQVSDVALKGTTRAVTAAAQSAWQLGENVFENRAPLSSDVIHMGLGNTQGDAAARQAYGEQLTRITSGGLTDPGGIVSQAKATDVGQVVQQVAQGGIGNVDMGSGFFPGGAVATGQAQGAREVRGIIPGSVTAQNPQGSARTIGRDTAVVFAEQGSNAYRIMSGFIDAAAVLAADPINHLHPLKGVLTGAGKTPLIVNSDTISAAKTAVDDAAKFIVDHPKATEDVRQAATEAADRVKAGLDARRTRDVKKASNQLSGLVAKVEPGAASDADKFAAGMVDGVRKTVHAPTTEQWIQSNNDLLQRFADDNSFTSINSRLNGRVDPRIVTDLVDASTPEEVAGVLRGALGGAIPNAPGLAYRGKLGEAATQFTDWVKDHRLFNSMPGPEWLTDTRGATARDLTESVRNMEDTLINARVPNHIRDGLLEDYARSLGGTSQDTYAASRAALAAVEAQIQHMPTLTGSISLPVTRNAKGKVIGGVARDIVNKMSDDADVIRSYAKDRMGNPTDYGLADALRGSNGDLGRTSGLEGLTSDGVVSPVQMEQGIRRAVSVPDPRVIRRLTASPLMRAITTQGVEEGVRDAAAYGMQRMPIAALDWFTTNAFKRLAVLRAAFIPRVVGEEMAYLSLAGGPSPFTHPIHFLGLAAGKDYRDYDILASQWSRAAEGTLPKDLTDFQQGMNVGVDLSDANATTRYVHASGDASIAHKGVDSERWIQGHSDHLAASHTNPLKRMVAAGAPTDDIVDYLRAQRTVRTITDDRVLAQLEGEPGDLFHGTSRPWESDRPSSYIFSGRSAENLMGAGLYTTDNPRVALSYTSKGARRTAETVGGINVSEGGRVYHMRWGATPKILDLEQPQTEVSSFLQRWVESNRDADYLESTQEDWDKLERLVADPNTAASEQIKAWRATLSGLPKSEADDIVSDLADHLSDTHDALKYAGGVRTGNETHNAYVVLHPEKLESVGGHVPVSTRSTTTSAVSAVRDTRGPDDLKELQGMLDKKGVLYDDGTRLKLDLSSDSVLRTYIDTVVRGDVKRIAGDNPTLLEAIAKGRIGFDEIPVKNSEIGAVIKRADGPNGPEWVGSEVRLKDGRTATIIAEPQKGQSTVRVGARAWDGREATPTLHDALAEWQAHPDSADAIDVWTRPSMRQAMTPGTVISNAMSKVTQVFFGHLYGKASDYLVRAPFFKQTYWDELEKMIPNLAPGEANKALKMLEGHLGEGDRLSDVQLDGIINKAKTANGTLDLEAADELAKGRALDKMHDTFYDWSRKGQFFDITRNIFPFGEAWKEMLTRYARLLKEDPVTTLRRAQLVVNGKNDSGWFTRDAQTGLENFNMPLVGPLAKMLTGADVRGHASVQGLTIGTDVIPGLGPAAQIGVANLLPDLPTTQGLEDVLFPYGRPKGSPTSLLPSWMQNAISAGFDKRNTTRLYGNTYYDVMKSLAASGNYDLSNQDEVSRMMDDAAAKARPLSLLKVALQFVSPSSPTFDQVVKTKQGDVLAAMIIDDLDKMRKDDPNNYTKNFLDKYGDQAFIYLQGRTRATLGGLDVTTAFGDWEQTHQAAIQAHPDVAGFFAPTGGDFDFEVWRRQINNGSRTYLTDREIIDSAQATMGRWQYYALRDAMGPKIGQAQAVQLSEFRKLLAKKYPGYDPTGDSTPSKVAHRVDELRSAKDMPDLAKTDVGQALSSYFGVRDAVDKKAVAAGVTSFTQAKQFATQRDMLRQLGELLAQKTPAFRRVWDDVLSREMKDDTPDQAAAA